METKLLKLAVGRLSDEVETLKLKIEELKKEMLELRKNQPINSINQNLIPIIKEPDNKILLDTKEVMEILGICYNSLAKLIKEGHFKPIKINQRRVRFQKASIIQYIQSQSQ
jgi:predicted DNA-binding transcriptional regulator AlpA